MDGTPLRIEELVKRFGNVAAVDGVSLKVKPGECFGLLGPNGAGKSTLIRSIVGRVRPSPGRILIFGETAESAAARAGCDRTGPPLQPQILKRHFQLNEAKRWVVDLLYADARASRCTSHKTAEQVAHTAVYGQELRVTLSMNSLRRPILFLACIIVAAQAGRGPFGRNSNGQERRACEGRKARPLRNNQQCDRTAPEDGSRTNLSKLSDLLPAPKSSKRHRRKLMQFRGASSMGGWQ